MTNNDDDGHDDHGDNYQAASQYYVVCLSVGLSVCHSSEPCKEGWTDRDTVSVVDSGGPKESRIKPWFHVKIKLF